jgi:hypothetical protein
MKKSILFLFVATSLLFSCSSDKDENGEDSSSNDIVGTWDATELKINNETASDDAKFGKKILDFLTNKDCFIITLQFNQDLTAVATNAANYVEVNANATGLDVPCPTQSDTESSTYTYDGSVVSFIDADGQQIEVRVTVLGDIMTVNAADLEIPNFDESGELIFRRR